MTSGSLAGFPVVDIVATLFDGSYHEVDSSALAFQARRQNTVPFGVLLMQGCARPRCFVSRLLTC